MNTQELPGPADTQAHLTRSQGNAITYQMRNAYLEISNMVQYVNREGGSCVAR